MPHKKYINKALGIAYCSLQIEDQYAHFSPRIMYRSLHDLHWVGLTVPHHHTIILDLVFNTDMEVSDASLI